MPSPLRRSAKEWAAIAALGPISGPLAARMMTHWQRGDRVLAGMYGVAILETALVLPLLATRMLGVELT